MAGVRVKQLTGSRYAWSHDQGLLVSRWVLRRLSRGEQVEVDFTGITALTLQFLNTAVGNLVRQIPWMVLKESVSLINFPLQHAGLLETILVVWRDIEFEPRRVVKKTSVMEDIAYWFTPFEKRGSWRKNERALEELRPLSA